MANDSEQYFKEVIARYRDFLLRARDAVGLIAVELFKSSFDKKGKIMANGVVYNWKQRGFGPASDKNRRLLKRRGKLQRSVNYKKTGRTSVTVVSDLPYSEIQNEGGKIKVTAKMRRFFFAMAYESWQRGVSYDVKTRDLKQTKANVRHGSDAEFWLKMAMAKEINIPARPFIYETPELPNRIDKYLIKQLQNLTNI